ncbi:hypothetical protein TNCV_3589241 [Trichonephila clavipes]|nr:hypothetical protein TNCV_3589241 [Trichonephila clavipes]
MKNKNRFQGMLSPPFYFPVIDQEAGGHRSKEKYAVYNTRLRSNSRNARIANFQAFLPVLSQKDISFSLFASFMFEAFG